jgi:hypothetical protein
LTKLPEKIVHPGAERQIGKEIGDELSGYPKYLWDNKNCATVLATKDILKEGYGALGYTWGRWWDH